MLPHAGKDTVKIQCSGGYHAATKRPTRILQHEFREAQCQRQVASLALQRQQSYRQPLETDLTL